MFKNKKVLLGFITLLLASCTVGGNSSQGSNSSTSSSDSSKVSSVTSNVSSESSTPSSSTTSQTPIKPSYSVITIHNLDKEYTVRLHDEYFEYKDIPTYSLEDREILGWYFDAEFVEPIEEGVTYYVGESIDIFAKVEFNANYFIKDFLVDSVSKVYINTEDNKKPTTKEVYSNGTFKIVDENVPENNVSEIPLRIKCRGNSSYFNAHLEGEPFENSKFSYKIKFDEKQDLFGFGKDKEWNLIANFMDRSFIRNHLVYSLSKLMDNLEFTIDHHYVELYINNNYQGLYMITESVKTGSNRVDIEMPYDSTTAEIPFMLEQDQKAVDGGEIEGVNYFWNHYGLPFSTKYPDDFSTNCVTTAQFKYIRNQLNAVYDHVTQNDYANYIDVNSFIDYFMVQEIFRNVDVNHSSVYLYQRPGEVMKMGPIWDFDLSMGNYDYIPSHPEQFLKSLVGGGGNYLYNNLMRHNQFKSAYIKRFNFVRDTYLEAMRMALPEIIKTLKPYAEADYQKNRTLNNYVDELANNPDLVRINSFEGQVKYIEDYMFNGITSNGRTYTGRIPWLGTYLKNY